MKKRDFIKTSTLATLGTLAVPLTSCESSSQGGDTQDAAGTRVAVVEFTLPDLLYAPDALEPHIDAQTMGIHHDKHHAGYVRKLNAALEGHALAGKDLIEIVSAVSDAADDTGVRNNGGGHFNHSLFWKVMKPGGGEVPEGVLGEAIASAFGSYDTFKEEFSKAAATRFGSGWAWLSVDGEGKLFVSSTPNQDNPLMSFSEQKGTPILGIDVWEHAYYLNYQNRRGEYIDNFFSIINWEAVAANMAAIG